MERPTPHPLVEHLRQRLAGHQPDHPAFTDAAVDISELTPRQLGSLWPAIRQAVRDYGNPEAQQLASAILQQVAQLGMSPVLDQHSVVDSVRQCLDWREVVGQLGYWKGLPSTALREELRRRLKEPSAQWALDYHPAYVMTRLLDQRTQDTLNDWVNEHYANAPYARLEFALLEHLEQPSLLALAGSSYWAGVPSEELDPAIALADDAAYIEFSQQVLTQAHQRLDDIHSGRVPYVADGAFTTDDTPVIARAARVALLRDEAWLPGLLDNLLAKSCVAPTLAKTAPSQSLAIALGHAIEQMPTPESVQALHHALSLVRHASVQKKLSRNLKPAERALAQRPDIALRLAPTSTPGKAQRTLLGNCLESGLWQPFELSLADWHTHLADSAVGTVFAHSLVWRARNSEQTRSFLLEKNGEPSQAMDAHGERFALSDDSHISLWHPLLADESERHAWQALIRARKLKQPLRQVFREYYLPKPQERQGQVCQDFIGHSLSIRPLLGLARREGWKLDREGGLNRVLGDIRVSFRVDAELYPGMQGRCLSGAVSFARRSGRYWQPLMLDNVPPQVFSEGCRAVDLLVSVASFALEEPTDSHNTQRQERLDLLAGLNLSQMAVMRRETLKAAFAGPIENKELLMETRHVRVGQYAVHLATGRVTQEGAPVDLELSAPGSRLAAMPWLPYDEALLERIADTVYRLLHPSSPGDK